MFINLLVFFARFKFVKRISNAGIPVIVRVTRRPALCGTVPHWKILSRNTQALDVGRIFLVFQRYFKPSTNNQNNYSKEKSIFEYFLELVVSHIKFISKILVLIVSLTLLRSLLLLNTYLII